MIKPDIINRIENERTVTLHTSYKGKTYDVEARYRLGGWNHFTGKEEPRGYVLSVTPVRRSVTTNGIIATCYTAFSGTKVLVQEANRFSQKTFKKFVDQNLHLDNEWVQRLFADVLGEAS